MRIALLVGETLHWLAGNPLLPERLHSSAGDVSIGGSLLVQESARVRASAMAFYDRGNRMTTVSWSTSRQFASVQAAELWAADHDEALPRAGTLILESVGADGSWTRRNLANAIVQPPDRRLMGRTILLSYQAAGAAITAGESGAAPVVAETTWEGLGAAWETAGNYWELIN